MEAREAAGHLVLLWIVLAVDSVRSSLFEARSRSGNF